MRHYRSEQELVCPPLEEHSAGSVDKLIRGADDRLSRNDDGELFLVAKDSSRAWIVDGDDPVNEKV